MDTLIMIAQLLLSLTILVFIHELGHFLAARAFGIRVEKFYIFFDAGGKKLFSFTKNGTEYGIGWLPLGGYVKIAGMIDESMDKEQMKQDPQPWEFRSKPAWQRFIVMIGGIVMNILLAFIIYSGILLKYEKNYLPAEQVYQSGIHATPFGEEIGFKTGDKLVGIDDAKPKRFKDFSKSIGFLLGKTMYVERDGKEVAINYPVNRLNEFKGNDMFFPLNHKIVVGGVVDASIASGAGVQEGDIVAAVDSMPVEYYGQFQSMLEQKANDTVVLSVNRNNETVALPMVLDSTGKIGVMINFDFESFYTPEDYTFFNSIGYGITETVNMWVINVLSIKNIFKGNVSARNVQSPIGMAKMFGVEWVWERFWVMTALISVALAFFNFLPIPALDGGHMVFLIWEMIFRKPLPDKFLEVAQVVGIVLLLTLMVLTFGNDILKNFGI